MTLDVTEARELEKERDPEAVGKATPLVGRGAAVHEEAGRCARRELARRVEPWCRYKGGAEGAPRRAAVALRKDGRVRAPCEAFAHNIYVLIQAMRAFNLRPVFYAENASL
jgi:hypothetical protein